MNKALAFSTLLLVFSFGSACVDQGLIPVTGIDPRAMPLLNTMTMIAGTVESLGQTATAYSYTPTPSNTPLPPTKIPDPNEITQILTEAIHNKLAWVLGSKITVVNVMYGPVAAQNFTELYIEVQCEADNNGICPSSQVVSAVIDACKEKKKKVKENVPGNISILIITIYDPGHPTQVVEANWAHVIAYLDGDIPPDIFRELLRYRQY